MSHLKEVVLEPTSRKKSPGISTRLFSALILIVALFILFTLLSSGVQAFCDSWVAPINLSPENDRVIALKLQINRHQAEKHKIQATLIRIKGEQAANQEGLARLKTIRTKINSMADWNAAYQALQHETLEKMSNNLNKQKSHIKGLLKRNHSLLEESHRQLKAGLIGKTEYDKQKQAYEASKLSLQEVTRKKIEVGLLLRNAEQERNAWLVRTQADPDQITGAMPTVLAHEEAKSRLEMEILTIRSHLTALDFERKAAQLALSQLDEILGQIKSRPMVRAMEHNLDIAFVPYEELEGVAVGDSINACILSLFRCQKVGIVAEIIPGEVVTQDPWGELARGQYIVLDLIDHVAVFEKTLRVRRS